MSDRIGELECHLCGILMKVGAIHFLITYVYLYKAVFTVPSLSILDSLQLPRQWFQLLLSQTHHRPHHLSSRPLHNLIRIASHQLLLQVRYLLLVFVFHLYQPIFILLAFCCISSFLCWSWTHHLLVVLITHNLQFSLELEYFFLLHVKHLE